MATENFNEVRLTNFSPSLKKDLRNIALNHGSQLGPFLKTKLRELADKYPAEMKKAPKED